MLEFFQFIIAQNLVGLVAEMLARTWGEIWVAIVATEAEFKLLTIGVVKDVYDKFSYSAAN